MQGASWVMGLTVLMVAVMAVVGRRRTDTAAETLSGAEPSIERRLDLLVPAFRLKLEAALQAAAVAGYDVRVTETYRTRERQRWLRAAGRSTVDVGNHNAGLAADVVVTRAPSGRITPYSESQAELDALAAVGRAAREQGLAWGGDWRTFRDAYHLELPRPAGVTYAVAADRYDERGPAWLT